MDAHNESVSVPALRQGPGLYVHIPFCARKCPYCDFYSVTVFSRDDQDRLLSALLSELDFHLERHPDVWTGFDTLYVGGGTPSILEPAVLAHLFAGIRTKIEGASARLEEVTCELNPADLSEDLLEVLAAGQVTRLSLGVQSFDDRELRLLGRRHDAQTACKALDLIRSFRLPFSLGIDLIHDLPGSTVDTWKASLRAALGFEPDHLSCYALTIARDTPFARWVSSGRVVMPGEEERADQYFAAHELLGKAGFDHYEVSNYARTQKLRSRHNVKYWTFVPYLGLGPSAHSFDGHVRFWNPANVSRYLDGIESTAGKETAPRGAPAPWVDWEPIGLQEHWTEALGLGLRWVGGIAEDDVTNKQQRGVKKLLHSYVEEGLLEKRGGRFVPTVYGMALADGMAAQILALDEAPRLS